MKPLGMHRVWQVVLGAATLGAVVALGAGSAAATGSAVRPAEKVVLFASDGMRPDLMERYAREGAMPTYARLLKDGAAGDDGMVQAFPPNTGVGWYTIATGTYPSEHGSTNNTFFRSGDAFTSRTSFSGSGVLQADTIANAAERAGKKVAQIEWTGGRSAGIAGPTVDFANFFSTRGVLTRPAVTSEQNGAAAFGLSYQVASFAPAAGWTNVPAGDPATTPMQTTLAVNTTFAAQNPNRSYDVYVYDGVADATRAYDHVLLVRSAAGKDGSQKSADLKAGDWKEIKLKGADGLIGSRAGQTAGFYVKLITLSPDLSSFKLYFTSVERVIATCSTAACNALPAGGAGEDRLEKHIADDLPTAVSADFAPEEAGIIDEDTYVEQGRDLEAAYGDAVLRYVLGELQPDTDLALVGYPFTDEVSHQFMGLVTPSDPDGSPNPCYDVLPKFDDVQCTGRGTAHRVEVREGYIRSAYHEADAKLKLARDLMGGNPTTFATSDHGFGAQRYAVNANKVLFDATVHNTVTGTDVPLHASNANASNCGAAATDLAKACWAGGTIQVYVNTSLPAGITYEAVRTAAIDAFQRLTDPANPGKQVVAKVLRKEELRDVDGSDSLHPNRSGDVVVVTQPPYQSDAGTNGVAIALSHFFGQHGYLPSLVSRTGNVDMHATFVAGGPGIERSPAVKGVRAIDVAPTIAFLMGIPGPQNARGRILYDIVEGADQLVEVTLLDISDYHGQLIPLSEAADSVGPTFGIGGSAFLKKWFETYEAESARSSDDGKPRVLELAAGDSVGATPPISNFFGDKPTIELMNMMGIDVDGLGNHNFDRGQEYLRTQLIPLADYPFVSANIVDAAGKTPAEWSPSHVFTFDQGVKLGIVGFSNDDLLELTNPEGVKPFHVADSTAAVDAEAAALAPKTDAVVAIGHLGATEGTLTDPSGPLVDLADHVSNVAAVIGDHTDFQVLTTRGNGVLVTENRSKGIRFTRIRLVIGPGKQGVVYKTADFHKPWDIGVTPDAAIQARIDDLNGQLGPILSSVIGSSSKFIPRADQCGNDVGRTCESLVGDVVADAMRTKYAPIGVDFAITNSGGLRSDLTCPTTDNPSDFCPAYTPPPFPITRGQVLTELPFGNIVVTLTVTGAELKTMLENGVGQMPAVAGRFPQVSGLCFTYDIAAPAGSRVVSAVRADASGNCTATPVDLTAASSYKIAENDFMANGGDGYPFFTPRVTTQDIMDQVAADYIAASSPLSPVVKAAPNGRINCVDGNGAAAPSCPALVPSP
ncbi:MAG TPA: 5'-nucleotidase C-terminal domain-containing protein [Gaiellaceae bacterium]|nr:5'-nucleotidase C-terminal domain-containing protein [Gaiellaceae bacterium]